MDFFSDLDSMLDGATGSAQKGMDLANILSGKSSKEASLNDQIVTSSSGNFIPPSMSQIDFKNPMTWAIALGALIVIKKVL